MNSLHKPALVLIAKAREDIYIARMAVKDEKISDEQSGFFCQQAIEKSLKAVLAHSDVRFHRGHDLATFLDLLAAAKIAYPPELDGSLELTPFAAALPYDFLPKSAVDGTPFDRNKAFALAEQAVQWAASVVGDAE